jgi:hypothetical protein
MTDTSSKPFYKLTVGMETAVHKVGGMSKSEARALVSMLNSDEDGQENHHYIQGVQDMADELKSLCKDFSDRQNRPYMGDVHSAVDSLRDRICESSTRRQTSAEVPSTAEVATKNTTSVETLPGVSRPKNAFEGLTTHQKDLAERLLLQMMFGKGTMTPEQTAGIVHTAVITAVQLLYATCRSWDVDNMEEYISSRP